MTDTALAAWTVLVIRAVVTLLELQVLALFTCLLALLHKGHERDGEEASKVDGGLMHRVPRRIEMDGVIERETHIMHHI